jgi:hypothetical protein
VDAGQRGDREREQGRRREGAEDDPQETERARPSAQPQEQAAVDDGVQHVEEGQGEGEWAHSREERRLRRPRSGVGGTTRIEPGAGASGIPAARSLRASPRAGIGPNIGTAARDAGAGVPDGAVARDRHVARGYNPECRIDSADPPE